MHGLQKVLELLRYLIDVFNTEKLAVVALHQRYQVVNCSVGSQHRFREASADWDPSHSASAPWK